MLLLLIRQFNTSNSMLNGIYYVRNNDGTFLTYRINVGVST